MKKLFLIMAVLSTGFYCFNNTGTNSGVSCDYTGLNMCTDYTKTQFDQALPLDTVQSICTGFGGTWSNTTACPASAIGSCDCFSAACSGGYDYTHYYYTPGFTQTSAESHCLNLPGTYTPL